MSTLVCFGLGYSAEHFVGTFGDGFERIVGTVRGAERAAGVERDASPSSVRRLSCQARGVRAPVLEEPP